MDEVAEKSFELRKFKGNLVHFQVQPSQHDLKYGNIIEICGFSPFLHSWALYTYSMSSILPAKIFAIRELYTFFFNTRKPTIFLIYAICSWDHIKDELYIKM